MSNRDENIDCMLPRTEPARAQDTLRAEPGTADDFALLDAGARAFTDHELRRLADGAILGKHATCGKSRNSVCFKISSAIHGKACLVLKQAVMSAARTNPDHTFRREADNLKILARLEIPGCPELLARFRFNGSHYLLLTFVPGAHPHTRRIPLQEPVLRQLFDTFFLMDQAGFIHYDLQAPNIVISQTHTGLIDFEFAAQGTPFSIKDEKYLCDYNISPNPYVPLRSCVSNFEFRTLYPYLAQLRSHAPERAVVAFARSYLRCKAQYHTLMGDYFASVVEARTSDALSLFPGGIRLDDLQRGARYETVLAGLYRSAPPEVLASEYLIMKLRFEMFERDFNGRCCDLDSGFSHAGHKVRGFADRASNPQCCPALWYFTNSLELLNKLKRKAAEGSI